MLVPLHTFVEVRAGHPFRGSVPVSENGNAAVIQMRDVSPNGSIGWAGLSRTEIHMGKTADWLHPGDILFASRGARNYAVCLEDVPAQTVCSQYFFVLRCKDKRLLAPYLAWHINRAPSQRYLAGNAEGSDQLSIRRTVLEDMPIAVPSLARQAQLVEFASAVSRERLCLEALIKNGEQQLDALAYELLSPQFPNN